MKIIEIVDDAGDEFSVMNIPIPFYIRCKLNEGLTKYRVKILDETKHVRSQYTGASNRDFLEVHVPVIPLRDYGKLFIHIELDNDLLDDRVTHETTISYVDQETYESITGKTRKEPAVHEPGAITNLPQPIMQDTSHQLSSQELRYLTLGEEKTEEEIQENVNEESSSSPSLEESTESEQQTNSVDSPVELSPDELSYLTQNPEILQEDGSNPFQDEIKELSEIRMEEEE